MAISETAVRITSRALQPPLARVGSQTSVLPATWTSGGFWALGAVLIAAAPLYSSRYQLTILVAVFFAIIGSIAMNLILGVAGQASIGNSAFMAIGAFAAAKFAIDLHFPFLVTVVASGLSAGVIGVLIGIPAMRVRGLYLVIATLALYYVSLYILNRYQSAKVGSGQFLMPNITFLDWPSVQVWYYIMLAGAALAVMVMHNLLRTRFGRAWLAVARDEIAAEVLGVNVRLQKVTAFGLTSLMIGIQGALFAYYLGVVSTDSYTFDLAVSYIAMVIIGGHASTGGSILGAIFVTAIPYVVTALAVFVPDQMVTLLTTRLFDIETIVYGASIVVFLVLEPRGLIYLWNRAMNYFRLWPLAQNVAAVTADD